MSARRRFLVLLAVLLVSAAANSRAQEVAAPAPTTAPSILALLARAYTWQLSILPTEHTGAGSGDTPVGWIRAPFYDGAMAVYAATGDSKYLNDMLALAQENHFELGSRTRKQSGLPGASQLTGDAANAPYPRFADDLAVGQFYAELYRAKHDEAILAPLEQRLDGILAGENLPGRQDWWWCDSLFMAPATFSHVYTLTGDRKYLDFADKQFRDTTDFLYDKDEHLYFRDKSYFTKKEANGRPIFWSRGNGWVLAGIARFLADLPADYPTRGKYVQLYMDMAEKIASLQQPDGFWRVSLLDPDHHPGGETSGTGFYCYAMAWGINHGLLPREKYLLVVTKAWAALVTAIDPSTGAVGWVQPVGAAPAVVKPSNVAEYGTGAFLLAGSEMLKLNQP